MVPKNKGGNALNQPPYYLNDLEPLRFWGIGCLLLTIACLVAILLTYFLSVLATTWRGPKRSADQTGLFVFVCQVLALLGLVPGVSFLLTDLVYKAWTEYGLISLDSGSPAMPWPLMLVFLAPVFAWSIVAVICAIYWGLYRRQQPQSPTPTIPADWSSGQV